MLKVVARAVVKPGNEEKFIEAAREMVAKTRAEEGNISYTLVQGVENPALLTFLEEWRDEAALQEHLATEHFTRIVKILGDMQDGPTQLDLYKVVI